MNLHKNSFELFKALKTSDFYNTFSRPVIIADNLRTPENMGSVLRLAGNIGAQKTLFISDVAQEFKNYKINKTASGATEKTDWKIIPFNKLGNELSSDYQLISLETTKKSTLIYDFEFAEKTAFIIGNEVNGIRQELLEISNNLIYIPMPGPISSLNTTHALSIALFEWYRQMVKIS